MLYTEYFLMLSSLRFFCLQCMAACFFLLKQFDDVLLYLNSIKAQFININLIQFTSNTSTTFQENSIYQGLI